MDVNEHDRLSNITLKVKEECFYCCAEEAESSERTTNHGQATGKLYHLRLGVECTLFCNLQSRVRTHVILVIGLYEVLGNPNT
jgi:hypothetical protein